MRDPHVERLHYHVTAEGDVSYDNASTADFPSPHGSLRLADGRLTVNLTNHFGSVDAARVEVERFLRGWQIYTDLKDGVGTIRFRFDRADVIDLNPPPPGTAQVVSVEPAAMEIDAALQLAVTVVRRSYPGPPTMFLARDNVEEAHQRFLQYQEGREPLQAMAYYVLTRLGAGRRGDERRRAAARFQIELDVLERIGTLSSEHGDAGTARKHQASPKPLTAEEARWLEHAVKRVILRMGEEASGATLSPLTMADVGT